MDKAQERKLYDSVVYREIAVDSAAAVERADADGPITIAFSSETPARQWFGEEILDHSPGSVRLDRLNNGAPLLVNHNRDDLAGVVEPGTARIDPDRVGRLQPRFSRSARGQEIEQDMRDGIRLLISVGYKVHKYEIEERDGLPDLVRVTDWEPIEISSVSVPADATVGVGRSEGYTIHTVKETAAMPEVKETENEVERAAPAPVIDRDAELSRLRTEETKRRSAIDRIVDQYELPDDLRREAIAEGWDESALNAKALEEVGRRNNAAKVESRSTGELDLSPKERKRYSFTRLLHHLADPSNRRAAEAAAFEREVSHEGQSLFGADFKARGEYVPTSVLTGEVAAAVDQSAFTRALGNDPRSLGPVEFINALRALNVGTAAAGGDLVGTDHLSGSFIDVLRNMSAAMRAGVTMLPGLVGNVDIPRQTSGATATWISAEDGDATEDEPTFDQVVLSPKDLACYTEFTRRLTQQSAPAIEGLVRNDLAFAEALGTDKAVLYGSGAAGQPTGVALQTGINKVTFAAADPTYLEVVQMIKEVMKDNALIAMAMWLIDAEGWEALCTTPKQGGGVEGNFILGDNDRIKGYEYIQSQQVAAEDYFFGVWSQVLCGEWGGREINVDPYTHVLKGRTRYVMFKTTDVAVRHPEAFCLGNDTV